MMIGMAAAAVVTDTALVVMVNAVVLTHGHQFGLFDWHSIIDIVVMLS